MTKHYESAQAFKTSLEARFRTRSKEHGVSIQTLQLRFTIERLLARLFHDPDPIWLLKGGFAMDLRFRPRARTTRDVDLSIPLVPPPSEAGLLVDLQKLLQMAADIDLGDHMSFYFGEAQHELTNAPAGGARFLCEARLAGKVYSRFHLDVGCGDVPTSRPEQLTGDDILSFAGVEPAVVLAIPKSQQFAEKIHAYSFPWTDRENTRTRDLVDMLMMIERSPPDVDETREAIRATFGTRDSHPIPPRLNVPPTSWEREFARMALEAGLSTTDYLVAFERVAAFWTANSLNPESPPPDTEIP